MKIHDVGGQSGPKRPEAPGDDRAKTPQPVEAKKSEGDRVELSGSARRLASLVEAADRLPEVRQERVERLRSSIEEGSYRIEPRVLARAILEFEDGIFN